MGGGIASHLQQMEGIWLLENGVVRFTPRRTRGQLGSQIMSLLQIGSVSRRQQMEANWWLELGLARFTLQKIQERLG